MGQSGRRPDREGIIFQTGKPCSGTDASPCILLQGVCLGRDRGAFRRLARETLVPPKDSGGVVDMQAGDWQGSRLIPGRWRLAELVVLLAFSFFVLDLPVHLVHHLGEVNPDCQLLGFSVSLSTASLDSSRLPSIDRTWDVLCCPVLSPTLPLLWTSAQARAPPRGVQS
jgi:hypothetical protein